MPACLHPLGDDQVAAGIGGPFGLADPPVRRIAAVRLAPSFRSAAATSMLGVLKETANAFGV